MINAESGMSQSSIRTDDDTVVIDEFRPVCAGALDHEMRFAAIAFHPHVGGCPGSDSGSNYRASTHCPIRTYRSCHEVDGRFDGQFVSAPVEVRAAADAMLGAVRGWIHVVMPVALAMRMYGYVDTDFDFDGDWTDFGVPA